uniref:Major facilitator superfamily (MFS) profile domain-containing protein n=1 Tax=Globodera rostochiensis TaxID=31243 RepID=A0A914IBK7_GLORO
MAEMNSTTDNNKSNLSSKNAEQSEQQLIIKAPEEGLVEITSKLDGVKQSAPVKDGHLTNALIFAILSCTIGSSFQFGYHIGCINVPAEFIKAWLRESHGNATAISDAEINSTWGIAVGIFAIGGMVSGIMVGVVADRLGRRQALLYNNALAMIAAALMTSAKYAHVFWLIVIGRFIIGVNAGLNSGLAPMYLTEISPANLRGSIGSLAQLTVTISILVSQIIGLPFLLGTDTLWPGIFAFTLIPAIFQLCTLPLCPESPKFNLIIKGRKDQAEKDLKKLRGEDVSAELEMINAEAVAARSQPQVNMLAMLKAPLLWPLVLTVFMMLSQQLSGINAAMFYSTKIFKDAGLKEQWPNYATILMGAINVLMTVVSVYMVERVGRRNLQLIGLSGMCVTTAMIAISMLLSKSVSWFSFMSIIFVLLFVISFATGPGSIPWFFVNEVFPANALGNAISVAVVTNWGTNALVGLGFPFLQDLLNLYSFFVFTVMLVLFTVFAFKFLPETKNKPLEEIHAEMEQRRKFG